VTALSDSKHSPLALDATHDLSLCPPIADEKSSASTSQQVRPPLIKAVHVLVSSTSYFINSDPVVA
jgi:hypothetical protein